MNKKIITLALSMMVVGSAHAGLLDKVFVTPDMSPYKKRKVRILNGAHTGFVLGAYLAGENIVRDCMHDEVIKGFTTTTSREGKFVIDELYANASLDLFDMAGGRSAVAFGLESRSEDYADTYDSLSEAGAVAALYALLLTVFVYRSLSWEHFLKAAAKASKTTGIVLLLVGASLEARLSRRWLLTAAAAGCALLILPNARVGLVPLLIPLEVCPKAPPGAQKYADDITGYVLWGVIALFGVGVVIAIGAIVADACVAVIDPRARQGVR